MRLKSPLLSNFKSTPLDNSTSQPQYSFVILSILAPLKWSATQARIFLGIIATGTPTPLYQVSNISTPEASQILIKPYDRNQLKEIERAIINADLGFTPLNDGTVIRCNVPQLTGETRARLVKDVYKMAEEGKVAVRNIRRDAISELKKDKSIPEDTLKNLEEEVQKLTDKATKKMDELAKAKADDLSNI